MEYQQIEHEEPWRVDDACALHVWQGNRPVATFHNALEAEIAVRARNNSTPVLISPEMIQDAAQAIRDSNLTLPAAEAWGRNPQLVPAHIYAEAVLASLLEQGYVIARATPEFQAAKHAAPVGVVQCPVHDPVQHRDGKEPWCNECGLTQDFRDPSGRVRGLVDMSAVAAEANRVESNNRSRLLASVRTDDGRNLSSGKNYDDAGGFDRPGT